MKVTSSQQLPYPEINDPGDAALELQVLAEAIDAKVSAELVGYRSVLNDRQVEVFLASVDNGAVASNTMTQVSYDTILYSSDGIGVAAPFFNPAATASVYVIGAYLITNPTGTVTANTFRDLFLQVGLYQGPVLNTFITELYQSRVYESSSGGEHQTLVAVVNVPSPPTSTISVLWQHANAGSTVQVKAGSICWMNQIGTVD